MPSALCPRAPFLPVAYRRCWFAGLEPGLELDDEVGIGSLDYATSRRTPSRKALKLGERFASMFICSEMRLAQTLF